MVAVIIDWIATLMEAVSYCILMDDFPKERFRNKAVRYILCVAAFVGPVQWLTYILKLSPDIKMFVVILLYAVLAAAFFRKPWGNGLFLSAIFYLHILIGEIAVQVLILLTTNGSVVDFISGSSLAMAVAIISSKVIMLILVFVTKRIFGRNNLPEFFPIGFLLLIPVYFMIIWMAKLETMLLGYSDMIPIYNVATFASVSLFAAVAILWTTHYCLDIHYQRVGALYSRKYMDLSYDSLITSEEDSIKLRAVCHDLKNHISAIADISDPNEKVLYMDALCAEIDQVSGKITQKSGIDILDAMFQRVQRIHGVTVHFVCDGDPHKLDQIPKYDLVTIFSNLIENAAAAAQKTEKKDIDVTMREIRDFILLEFVNDYIGEEPDISQSSKQNKELHGYGLHNVRSTVGRYHGTIVIHTENNRFVVQIMVPI